MTQVAEVKSNDGFISAMRAIFWLESNGWNKGMPGRILGQVAGYNNKEDTDLLERELNDLEKILKNHTIPSWDFLLALWNWAIDKTKPFEIKRELTSHEKTIFDYLNTRRWTDVNWAIKDFELKLLWNIGS